MGIDLLHTASEEQVASLLSMLRSSCNSLSHILDDVLSMQKIEEGQYSIDPSFFDIGEIVAAVESQYGVQCNQKGIQLRTEMHEQSAIMYFIMNPSYKDE